MISLRKTAWVAWAALALPLSAAAQQIAGDPPLQWQAMSKANKQAQSQAEKIAYEARPKPIKGHGREPDRMPPGAIGNPRITSASLLRSEMDFAAPLEDTLILYRSREAVVFGRKESSEVVILPLSGDPVQVAAGIEASVKDAGDDLDLEIVTSGNTHVNYHYHVDEDGVLQVKVHATGSIPMLNSSFDVERQYQLQQTAR